MSHYRCNFDDVALGTDFAVFARGYRRFLIANLGAADVAFLAKYRSSVETLVLTDELRRAMIAKGLLVPANIANEAVTVRAYLSSGKVVFLARYLTGFARPSVLVLLIIIGLICAVAIFLSEFSSHQPLTRLSGMAAFAAVGGFYVSLFFHELGHAAACLLRTGTVGGIRLGIIWILPSMATDVTSSALVSPKERFWISAAGPIFHGVVFVPLLVLLIFAPATGHLVMVLAISNTLAIALSVIPSRGNDGFWMLKNIAGYDLRDNSSSARLTYTVLKSLRVLIIGIALCILYFGSGPLM